MNLVLLGAPGCGKGYISNLIIDEYGFTHISTGNLLRENIKNKTDLGAKIERYMNNGELVPDALVLGVLKKALEENKGKNIIFDGYPRTIDQAKELDKLTNIDVVASINVPEDVILDRISSRRVCLGCSAVYSVKDYSKTTCDKCGGEVIQRKDDSREVVLNRLEKYEIQTKPLINFYKEQNKLIDFDNNGDSQKSFSQLKKVIDKYVK